MSTDAPAPGARPAIVVIAGVTGAGKTEVALRLARAIGGELVGADSVQVYRGFDIGSAKPSAEELQGVRHHLIDVIDPDEEIDAARFAGLADEAMAGVATRGRLPIVVGGTGLWLRALVRGLVALPAPDPAIRAALEAEIGSLGAPALHARLTAVDPRAAGVIHPNDALRIVRALEVHAQTGEPLGELRHRHALGEARYRSLFVVLDRPRDVLRERLETRVNAMIARGWVEEVRELHARWGGEVRAFGSVGYRDILAHVSGHCSLEEATARASRASWVYARRQRTWFGSEPGIDERMDPGTLDTDALLERVRRFLERSGVEAGAEPRP